MKLGVTKRKGFCQATYQRAFRGTCRQRLPLRWLRTGDDCTISVALARHVEQYLAKRNFARRGPILEMLLRNGVGCEHETLANIVREAAERLYQRIRILRFRGAG